MSRKEWGEFITSRPTPKECRRTIVEFNQLLRRLGLPEEVILGVVFEVHPCYDNVLGRNWYHGIYLTLDKRASRAISALNPRGNSHALLVAATRTRHRLPEYRG